MVFEWSFGVFKNFFRKEMSGKWVLGLGGSKWKVRGGYWGGDARRWGAVELKSSGGIGFSIELCLSVGLGS
jgi:hypothetical protein